MGTNLKTDPEIHVRIIMRMRIRIIVLIVIKALIDVLSRSISIRSHLAPVRIKPLNTNSNHLINNNNSRKNISIISHTDNKHIRIQDERLKQNGTIPYHVSLIMLETCHRLFDFVYWWFHSHPKDVYISILLASILIVAHALLPCICWHSRYLSQGGGS